MAATRRYRSASTRPTRSVTPLVRMPCKLPGVRRDSGEGRQRRGARRRGIPGTALRDRFRLGRGRPRRYLRPPLRLRPVPGGRTGPRLRRRAAPARDGRHARAAAPRGGGGGLPPALEGAGGCAVGAAGGRATGPGAGPQPAAGPPAGRRSGRDLSGASFEAMDRQWTVAGAAALLSLENVAVLCGLLFRSHTSVV